MNENALDALKPHLRGSRTLFDVGANAGYITRGLAERLPEGECTFYLFEPVDHLIALAASQLHNFRGHRYHYINAAVTERNGTATMYLPDDGDLGRVTLIHGPGPRRKSIGVQTVSLAPFMDLSPDFIKVDVEGAEAPVLEATVLDGNCQPTVYVELGWGAESLGWSRVLSVLGSFASHGYRFFSLGDGKFTHEWEMRELATLDRTLDLLLLPAARE